MTSNHNHTECIIDLYALRRPIIDVVFEDGIAVSVSFFVAICYSLFAAFVQYRVRKDSSNKVGRLSKMDVFLKSFFPGFALGSEFFYS